MKIEQCPLDSIKPYDRNPRNNDNAVQAVARSIQQFGFRQPIVVDTDNVIVCGHTRGNPGHPMFGFAKSDPIYGCPEFMITF